MGSWASLWQFAEQERLRGTAATAGLAGRCAKLTVKCDPKATLGFAKYNKSRRAFYSNNSKKERNAWAPWLLIKKKERKKHSKATSTDLPLKSNLVTKKMQKGIALCSNLPQDQGAQHEDQGKFISVGRPALSTCEGGKKRGEGAEQNTILTTPVKLVVAKYY